MTRILRHEMAGEEKEEKGSGGVKISLKPIGWLECRSSSIEEQQAPSLQHRSPPFESRKGWRNLS